MMGKGTQNRLKKIANAYDLTVEEYVHDIDPMAKVPATFRNSPAVIRFLKLSQGTGGRRAIRSYLQPKKGMKFLDVGSSADLFNYDHGRWASTYFGVDISLALVKAMRSYANNHGIRIGGLEVAEMTRMPFDDGFFDIAAAIGVLEYWNLAYCKRALRELHRVLRPAARVVLDMPNLAHPDAPIMRKLEAYLGRPHATVNRRKFESVLLKDFSVERIDDSGAMLVYYLKNSEVVVHPTGSR
ncbi:MAG: class I SAM-dependent methyltransferase [Candidatus Peribacteraceae bacterium]|nr:class I SAM-dependent methyltransferase [Candidatus Peribacteraceae bacterium]